MNYMIKQTKRIAGKLATQFMQEIATYLVFQKSNNLAQVLIRESSDPYLFIPYESPDCLALHQGIARMLKKHNIQASVDITDKFNIRNYIERVDSGNGLIDFQVSLHQQCEEHRISDLFYPILDTVIRVLPYDLFTSGFKLSDKFYTELIEYYSYLSSCCKPYNTCLIANAVYLKSNIIKQLMLSSGKSVYYLNPDGKVRRYNSINISEFSIMSFTDSEYEENQNDTENYLALRFSGKSLVDLDSSLAFGTQTTSIKPIKKVLFLHAFRDANNCTWSKNQPFSSYFEWVDFTFLIIKNNNDFCNWYIKVHPSSKYYENDRDILNLLLRKHDIPTECLDNVPSTLEILKSPMPIYTNNGTIVLESAANGLATYFCGSRFDPSFGKYASSKEEWANFIQHSHHDVERVSSMISQSAKYFLWETFARKDIPELVPSHPILPRADGIEQLTTIGSQCCNTIAKKSTITTIKRIQS